MRYGRFWYVGAVFLLVVLVSILQLSLRSRNDDPASHAVTSNLTPESVTWEAVLISEIQKVEAIGRKYQRLTPEGVRSNYSILQETNQVPTVLDMTAKDDQTGETLGFSFENGKLYQVVCGRPHLGGYQLFLNKDGRISSYWEIGSSGFNGVAIEFYPNGQLEGIEHYSNSMLVGEARRYDETGKLVFSTNYARPTLPVREDQGQPIKGSDQDKNTPPIGF